METGQFDLVPLNIFFYIFDMLFLTYSPNRKMIYQNYCNLFKVKPYFAWAILHEDTFGASYEVRKSGVLSACFDILLVADLILHQILSIT